MSILFGLPTHEGAGFHLLSQPQMTENTHLQKPGLSYCTHSVLTYRTILEMQQASSAHFVPLVHWFPLGKVFWAYIPIKEGDLDSP